LFTACAPAGGVPAAQPDEPTQTTEPEEPTQYEYSFEKFPNGRPITGNTSIAVNRPRPPYSGLQSLEGDEFSEWGFLVGPNSNPSCAVIWIGYLESDLHYLSVQQGGSSCEHILEITFVDPVQKVTLEFTGASLNYFLTAFNDSGDQISGSSVPAEFKKEGNPTQITVESNGAEIKRVIFHPYQGEGIAVIAVNKITYWR
jgi:hypothetical protein